MANAINVKILRVSLEILYFRVTSLANAQHPLLETIADIKGIISKIRSGKSGRDDVIQKLYYDEKLRQKVKAIIHRYGGTAEDFDEVFNTTLMQFIKTLVKNPDVRISSSLHSYLGGIAKYVWINMAKKENRHRTDNVDDQFDIQSDTTPETLLLDQSKVELLDGLLQKLGRNCREVLMHWANGYSMKEIAGMMDYKSDNMAKKKKYKCFKELLDYLESHPETKNALRS